MPVVNHDGLDSGVIDELYFGTHRDIVLAEAERPAPCRCPDFIGNLLVQDLMPLRSETL